MTQNVKLLIILFLKLMTSRSSFLKIMDFIKPWSPGHIGQGDLDLHGVTG